MNGWFFAAACMLGIILCTDPVRSQISCKIGVVEACEHLAAGYRK